MIVCAASCAVACGARCRPDPARVANRDEARWTKVSTEIGEITIPPGWDVMVNTNPGPRTVLYVMYPKIAIVIAAERVRDRDPQAIADSVHSYLEHNAKRQLSPVSASTVGDATVFCSSDLASDPFVGCGVVRPSEDEQELVIGFVLHADRDVLRAVGGVPLIAKVVASARNLVPGDPPPARGAP
jgi:hypothetical protein